MLGKIGLFGIVGVLLAAAPVRVDDGIWIKLKKAGKGDVTQTTKEDIDEIHLKIEADDVEGDKEKEPSEVAREEFKETILEMEKGKNPSKIRREYRKATVKKDEKEKTLPYDGKTVLIEMKDGKYHFTIEGGKELKGEDAKSLKRSLATSAVIDEIGIEEALMPKKRVKVNESWKFDLRAVAERSIATEDSEYRMSVDKSKMTGQSKLLRAYKKDGLQYGVIEVAINLPLKGTIPAEPGYGFPLQVPLLEGSKLTFHIRYDGCIDGKSHDCAIECSMSGIFVFTKSADGEGKIKITMQNTHKCKSRTTDLSKR